MLQLKKIITLVLCSSSVLASGWSVAFEIQGSKTVEVPRSASVRHKSDGLMSSPRTVLKTPVSVMKIKLSSDEYAVLQRDAQKKETKHFSSTFHSKSNRSSNMPSHYEIPMTDFPVSNQGQHGACVVFASVGALNYVLDAPSHVSELCLLTLGSTLAQYGHMESGWDGTFADVILERLIRFGYIRKSDQQTEGCAGLTEYPIVGSLDMEGNDSMEQKRASLEDYYKLSQKLRSRVYVHSLLTISQRFNANRDPVYSYDPDNLLLNVKKALLSNQSKSVRTGIILGMLLYGDECSVGACASTKESDDTWAVSKLIWNKLPLTKPDAGHELMIIGYDDNAVTTDTEGAVHRGLFKVRNSWGSTVGDHGDFYITYEYFKLFVGEVYQLNRAVW